MSQRSMFGKQLPQKLSKALREHSSGYIVCDLAELKSNVQAHLIKLESALAYNEFLDVKTARKVAKVFEILLSNYAGYSQREKSLVFGATQYFVHDLDEQPDTQSILGLDDDVQVLNYILDEIGRSDLKVDL